jgi:hypothetical protein
VKALPLDLHVLSTPPAFILSQDQTLQKKNLFMVSVEHLIIADQTDFKKTIQKTDVDLHYSIFKDQSVISETTK